MNFYRYMGVFTKEQRPQDVARAGSFYTFDKETINLWRTDKTKGFRLWVVNGEEVTREIQVSLTRFVIIAFMALNTLHLMIRMSSILVQGGYLSHGRLISCFQEDKGGSEYPSCTGCFLNTFNSKQSICRSINSMFWGDISWTPSIYISRTNANVDKM